MESDMPDAASETTSVLNTSAPIVTDSEVRDLLSAAYGIEGHVQLLTSERDKNYHVSSNGAGDFLLKITNAAEPREITQFQTNAIIEIARVDPALPVPRIVPTLQGETQTIIHLPGQASCVARLLTFLHGQPLYKTERTEVQRRNVASCLARLDLALRKAEGPPVPHELQWDIKHALKLRSKMEALSSERAKYESVSRVLGDFEETVAPLLPHLRSQVIHNDFNPHNLLVAPDEPTRVTGIIDFGDMVLTPLVIDLATACAYQVVASSNPLGPLGEFVAAYHEVCPLHFDEFSVLFSLLKARLVTTIVITNWRAQRYPENRTYILRNEGPAWTALNTLESIENSEARDFLLNACKMR